MCFDLFFPTMLFLYLKALEYLNIWKTISELGKNKGEVRNRTESGTMISSEAKTQLDKSGSLSEWINQDQLIEGAQKSNNSSKMLQDEASDEKNLICCAKLESVKDCTCCKRKMPRQYPLVKRKSCINFFNTAGIC